MEQSDGILTTGRTAYPVPMLTEKYLKIAPQRVFVFDNQDLFAQAEITADGEQLLRLQGAQHFGLYRERQLTGFINDGVSSSAGGQHSASGGPDILLCYLPVARFLQERKA